jgi:hypothetical protein
MDAEFLSQRIGNAQAEEQLVKGHAWKLASRTFSPDQAGCGSWPKESAGSLCSNERL